MDLRTGLPIWRALQVQPLVTGALPGDTTCEVLVIGAGVTGALIAHLLVQEGVDTLVIDRAEPALGSTAASTGLLQYEIDTPLTELIAKVGQHRAVHAYRRGLWAIDEIAALCGSWADTCGFSRRHSLYFASSKGHLRRLKDEFDCRREHGFDVTYWDQAQLAGQTTIPAAGAIWSNGDAQLDPYRFTLQLLRQATHRGARLASGTEAISVEPSSAGVTVTTNHGVIQARRIVYSTGYESHGALPDMSVDYSSTYAVASQPGVSPAGWPGRCSIWETARPYIYARQTEDGRVIVGGADTAFHNDHQRDELTERQCAALLKRAQELFPHLELVPEFAWAGTFVSTSDGLAYIGTHPQHPAAFFALGYGGNGVTFSMIAARLIADLYLGRPNNDAEVFSFDR